MLTGRSKQSQSGGRLSLADRGKITRWLFLLSVNLTDVFGTCLVHQHYVSSLTRHPSIMTLCPCSHPRCRDNYNATPNNTRLAASPPTFVSTRSLMTSHERSSRRPLFAVCIRRPAGSDQTPAPRRSFILQNVIRNSLPPSEIHKCEIRTSVHAIVVRNGCAIPRHLSLRTFPRR